MQTKDLSNWILLLYWDENILWLHEPASLLCQREKGVEGEKRRGKEEGGGRRSRRKKEEEEKKKMKKKGK